MFNVVDFETLEIVFEARYNSNIISLERGSAAKLAKKVKHVLLSRQFSDSNINFSSKDNSISANILIDKLGMNMINQVDIDEFVKCVKIFAPEALKNLEIEDLNRLGFRIVYISKKSSFEETMNTFYKLVSIDKSTINKNGILNSFKLNFLVKSGNIMSNIIINPGQKQMIQIGDNSLNILEHGIMIDVDIYMDLNNKQFKIENFIAQAVSHLRNNIFPIINNLGDENV